ncbi:hypothetical protein ACLB2K_049322 [Fragaria x ananassa]
MNCMRGSFAKAGVLYAPVEEIGSEGRQGIVCPLMLVAFISSMDWRNGESMLSVKLIFHKGVQTCLKSSVAGYIPHDKINLQETLD